MEEDMKTEAQISAVYKGGFHFLEGTYKKTGVGLFTKACSDWTTDNGLKLKESKFRLVLGTNSLL